MKAFDLIAQCLENEGVRHVFGLPGEEILDILDSLLGSAITFDAARAGSSLHGRRLQPPHRAGRRLPVDPGARRDQPRHGVGRRQRRRRRIRDELSFRPKTGVRTKRSHRR